MTRTRTNRSGFEQRLLRTFRELGLDRGEKLTVAFSGGNDSLALASGLARIAPLLEIDVILVHVDHHLRPGSSGDAAAAAALGVVLGLPVVTKELAGGLADRSHGIGIEEAARRERYLALAEAAEDWDSRIIVLAHHADDQAETVLLHLFRGSGLNGLGGMRLREVRPIPWWTAGSAEAPEMTLLRPLLGETRASLTEYLEATGLNPVVDESNDLLEADRNWVRHRVLPVVHERWPGAIENIGRSAGVVSTEREFLNRMCDDVYDETAVDGESIHLDRLLAIDEALGLRVVRRWLISLGIEVVDFDVVARVYDLAKQQDQLRQVEVGNDLVVVTTGDELLELGILVRRSSDRFPIMLPSGDIDWKIDVCDAHLADAMEIAVPVGSKPVTRVVNAGECWSGTDRRIKDDLRISGIHPLLRERLVAIADAAGILLIPAIYPTIRAANFDGPSKKVWVRWSRQS